MLLLLLVCLAGAVVYVVLAMLSKYVYVPNQHARLQRRRVKKEDADTKRGVAVFYGMCRNAMPGLETMLHNIQTLSRFFDDYCIVVLENGSTDGTRECLHEWTKTMKLNILDGDDTRPTVAHFAQSVPNSDTYRGPVRIARYVALRNQLHTAVVETAQNMSATHCVCMDLDQNVSVDEHAFYQSLQLMEDDPLVAVCTAHGKTSSPWVKPFQSYMYDTYAFLDTWLLRTRNNRNNAVKLKHIQNRDINVGGGGGGGGSGTRVLSNFGGMAVYRYTDAFAHNFYSVDNIDYETGMCDCEHVGFHKRLQNTVMIAFETFFDKQ